MLIVDDVVFSLEVWEWYHDRKNDIIFENNTQIKVFRPWMKEIFNTGDEYIDVYGELSGYDFYEFLHEIFMLFTDIQTTPMDKKYSTNDIYNELVAIEALVVYWALTEGHKKEDFGIDMVDDLLNSDTMAFSRKFHVESCYKMKAIWEGYNNLVTILKGRQVSSMPDIDIFKLQDNIEDDDLDAFMKVVIRESCGGDFDEFIISVMERMKFITMKEYHEKLSLIKGYELFGLEDFETKLPYTEIWRRLFPYYFDKIEDVYKLFYEKYIGWCILMIYNSYLSLDDTVISYIPIYKLYGKGNLEEVSTNIRFFVDPDMIKKRILSLYGVKIKIK